MSALPVEQSLYVEGNSSEEGFLAGLGILDLCEERMGDLPQVECKTDHQFIKTGGTRFYVRTITMPAGMLITSKIHITQHLFHISRGDVSVWTHDLGTTRLKAPYVGITHPLTKRLLFVHEETVWTTFHQGDWETVEEVEAEIILPHVNPRLQTPYFDCHNRPATHHLDGTPTDHNYVLHND